MAGNHIHTQIALDIYSRFFSELVPKEGPDGDQYWNDFFNITIIEPALIATFNSINLSSESCTYTTSIFFKNITSFFSDLYRDHKDDAYLLNNLLLILNAFIKQLKNVTNDQGKYYHNVSFYDEQPQLSNSQLITKILFNIDNHAEEKPDILDEEQEETLLTFFQVIKLGLNSPYLLKSSLHLLLNAILVFYNTVYFDYFYKVDMNTELYEKVLLRQFDNEASADDEYDKLSAIDYNRVFIILSTLVNTSKFGKLHEKNIYKIRLAQQVSNPKIFEVINTNLYHIISFNLILLDNMKPDLIVQKSYSGSFFNILTFNKFNKLNYFYDGLLSNQLDDELLVLLKLKKKTIQEQQAEIKMTTQKIAEKTTRINKMPNEFLKQKELQKLQKNIENEQIKFIESLSFNLVLYALVINSDAYNSYLTSYLNEKDKETIQQQRDDSDPSRATNNLIDLILSYCSFIFQNQHGNKVNHIVSRLNLLLVFKLLSTSTDVSSNLLSTSVNQFKYKICHHLEPLINNFISYKDFDDNAQSLDEDDLEDSEYKIKILYIVDVMQCFLRFNLTENLDIISIKLSVDNILFVLDILVKNFNIAMHEQQQHVEQTNDDKEDEQSTEFDFLYEYNWDDLFVTIFRLLKFLNSEKVISRKNSSAKFFSLVEEIFVLLDFILINNEKLFKYENYLIELIYKILENKQVIVEVSTNLKNFRAATATRKQESELSQPAPDFSIYSRLILCIIHFMNQKLGLNEDNEILKKLINVEEVLVPDQQPQSPQIEKGVKTTSKESNITTQKGNATEDPTVRNNDSDAGFKENYSDGDNDHRGGSSNNVDNVKNEEANELETRIEKLALTENHDFDYGQIANILRDFIDELPITLSTNKLLSNFATADKDKDKELLSEGNGEDTINLTLDSLQLLINCSQFPSETLKYLEKKDLIFGNYKISLVEEGIDLMINQFDQMFV